MGATSCKRTVSRTRGSSSLSLQDHWPEARLWWWCTCSAVLRQDRPHAMGHKRQHGGVWRKLELQETRFMCVPLEEQTVTSPWYQIAGWQHHQNFSINNIEHKNIACTLKNGTFWGYWTSKRFDLILNFHLENFTSAMLLCPFLCS